MAIQGFLFCATHAFFYLLLLLNSKRNYSAALTNATINMFLCNYLITAARTIWDHHAIHNCYGIKTNIFPPHEARCTVHVRTYLTCRRIFFVHVNAKVTIWNDSMLGWSWRFWGNCCCATPVMIVYCRRVCDYYTWQCFIYGRLIPPNELARISSAAIIMGDLCSIYTYTHRTCFQVT